MSAAPSGSQLTSTERQQLQREARLVVDLLQSHHYSGRAFRDIDNREMIDRYLREIDPNADFLGQEDYDYVHRRFDRTFKSVYLFRGDLQPAFEIHDLLAERARVRLAWIDRRLSRDFDLSNPGTITVPLKPGPGAAGADPDARWEQLLTSLVIREILLGRTPDDARETLARRFAKLGRRIATSDSFAIRERFFDAVIRSFDPHSGYFSAESTKEFAIDMANAVTGLGLELRKEDGRCVVTTVQPGGPADLMSAIEAGDTLLAVAEADGPWVDAASRRLREIVDLLRGKAGAKVRLAFRPAGTDRREETTLVRARVVLPENRVHGAISEVPGTGTQRHRVGWITLPSFYSGGEDGDTTSAARDMRELLDKMNTGQIEGLVLDLRQNRGGALTEAAAICELFLPGGCMMLSRDSTEKMTPHMLKESTPVYAGPLVVLTSAQSASASEILSGALKFYQRALVVGGETTFGKGTAQNYLELAKLPGIAAAASRDWGTLRLTYAKFFQPDGQSVQRTGIRSHIVLPDFDPPNFEREAALSHALPADAVTPPASVPPANAVPAALSAPLLENLRARAADNFAKLPEWELWRREQAYRRAESSRESYSLRLETRREEWAESLREYQELQKLRRPLATNAAFATRALEIPAVDTTYQAHERKLRQAAESGVGPYQLRRGHYLIETDAGRLREIPLEGLAVTAFYGDGDALAGAFANGSGLTIKPADTRRILEELGLLEHPTADALVTATSRVIGRDAADPAVRRGIESMLRCLVSLDGEMQRERPALDIPLREGLRLAAAWAEANSRRAP